MNRRHTDIFNASDISQFLETWLKNELLSGEELIIFNQYYHSYIDHFGIYLKYYYAQQTVELMNTIKLLENPAILEVGCGCGTESLWMAYNHSTVKGIDIREDRLAVARKRKSIMEQGLDRKLTCTFENRSLLDLNESKKFDIIWMGQTFHHLEPRNNVFDKLAELLKENGYIIISESNAWNPAMQLWVLRKRGFNTIREFIDESGKKHSYGAERILTPMTLCEEFSKRGVEKRKVRYFRILPNKRIADKLLYIERMIPRWFKPLFTHYNYIGEKKGGGSVPRW